MIGARRNIFTAFITVATLIAFADPATAQNISLDFGEGGSASARIIQLVLLLTVITLAPSILVMATSFTRIVVVLSILRTALGTQSTPPNSVVVSVALLLSWTARSEKQSTSTLTIGWWRAAKSSSLKTNSALP